MNLTALQVELLKWQHFVREQKTQHIILFEGVDAAGKSGAIKRFMEHMNPRYARVVALDKPTEQEKAQWYWQRYIQQFPKAGEICFFDRSWYNRLGVEPVMGFCTPDQALKFLRECNELEPVFRRAGIRLTKFFFKIEDALLVLVCPALVSWNTEVNDSNFDVTMFHNKRQIEADKMEETVWEGNPLSPDGFRFAVKVPNLNATVEKAPKEVWNYVDFEAENLVKIDPNAGTFTFVNEDNWTVILTRQKAKVYHYIDV